MHVRDALPGGGTVVQAQVIGIRPTVGIQRSPGGIEQGEQRLLLHRIELEERADMPLWNHQRMSRRDGVIITDHEAMFIAVQDA